MQETRVVFDVNIFVSYIIKDRMGEIFDMVFDHHISLYRNEKMRIELEDVLNRSKITKYLSAPLSYYIDFFNKVTLLHKSIPAFQDCADPKDNYLFDLAYQANAHYLVSGDKKVLATPVRESLQVVTLSTFKTKVKGTLFSIKN
jgi:putative PIN family toxin of toxin-antitoxin system